MYTILFLRYSDIYKLLLLFGKLNECIEMQIKRTLIMNREIS